uniref:Sulfhydryl oxidase n=1 Tax=Marseillevirus LCMAC201 TaxID=2506605 RepID=A0A481YWH8_9VIRU|nr:MAG: Erv1/Alr family disulfide (thiol) oxidoreductase [Marseillevirus LCMAC201]
MEKGFWGPATWCTIHTAATYYKPENRFSFKQFIYSLPYLLPCQYCRKHLFQNLRTLPLNDTSLENNKTLFMWSYFLHDLVNKQLHKKVSPAYPVVEEYYFGNENIWGPCFWRTLHAIAASYRPLPEVKEAFKQFVYSLTGILPCAICRGDYTHNLMQIPLNEEYLKDAHNLFLWSYLLHDLVNKRLGKVSPPFEEIKAQYFNDQICGTCGT